MAKSARAKKSTKSKSKSKKKAAARPQRPAFDEISFSGVGMVERRGNKRVLMIYNSREDAIGRGVSREVAEQLFEGVIAGEGGGACTEHFTIFGNVKCDNNFCTKTCVLQVRKPPPKDLGWEDKTEGTMPVVLRWAYRCRCK